MQNLTDNYVQTSASVLADNEMLASKSIGFKEMFSRSLISEHKTKLRNHFEKLAEYDREYATHLIAHGSII